MWISVAITVALTAVIALRLTPAQKAWSALAMLAWVVLSSLICSSFTPNRDATFIGRIFCRFATIQCWIALILCCEPWNMMLFKGVGNMFTAFFPVTTPPAAYYLWKSYTAPHTIDENKPYVSWRYTVIAVFAVAVGHLLFFYTRTSVATKLFLAFFVVVSGALATEAIKQGGDSQLAISGEMLP